MAERPVTRRRVWNFLEEEYHRAFHHDHWNIGIVDAPIHAFLDPRALPPVRWLPPPRPGKYYSDPFGLVVEGATTILFEEFDFGSGKGAISWVREGPDGTFSAPRAAIKLPFHTSYPFLLDSEGSVYCVPEMATANEIGIFRANDFPSRWTKQATLVPGVAGMDNTIVRHDGMFWLFCTERDDGPFSKLRIWYAPRLLGPWKAHPSNPVKVDPRSARPAGTPFSFDGKLYRPAQDCSRTYGGAITINVVEELSPTEFRERPITTMSPFRDGPYAHGVHTLSAVGDRTLVDGKWLAFNRSEMTRRFRESLEDRWPQILLRR